VNQHQKRTLTDALKNLSSLDLLQASHVGAVLYVEDESDYKILREWAAILDHPAKSFLSFPFVWPLRGKGNLGAAKRHFACLRLAEPTIKGLCILDRDTGVTDVDGDMPPGMVLRHWGRYEVENYLLNPAILKRYIDRPADIFGAADLQADRGAIDEAFGHNFPAAIDWLSDAAVLRDLKGSNFLVETLSRTGRPLAKRELYMLAARSAALEIHPDVQEMLDHVASILPSVVPAVAANASPSDGNGAFADAIDAGEGEEGS
jgi:hypothetical protein